ncbi:gluconate 2-dehydrogenase subunit 3 family protein [Algoriphagus sediminis]|uniref:Gluconate 2-dehydrogenase subunit 3 family protein n=1 Tax=Algoriphagus sediminis TaxID=3057113 RepID=A0ABT7Y9D8_9BACT|nr:gluconate 2-dehydrogenase subunit 3 family protein [Algoriphagus sediminis]MDN3203081.1 gluconate 2-dehydrogenase subunit 3 family protein [Algoriphagus sediminis]
MNRRENLKLLFAGSLGTGLFMTGCAPESEEAKLAELPAGGTIGGRTEEEKIRDQKLLAETFFTEEEKKKLSILVDIVMPADEESPSATEVGAVDFIDFMMVDQPSNQTRMRGGMMWLDFEANELFGKQFLELNQDQIMEIIDLVAWPDTATPEYEGGVKWFNMVRNFAATAFFSTEAGWKYMGYKGNTPNAWDGVPAEVMQKHGVELPEKYLDIYLKQEDRGRVAEWDDDGNLI